VVGSAVYNTEDRVLALTSITKGLDKPSDSCQHPAVCDL